MKIALASDIHLSVDPLPCSHGPADVLVLAGDVARPERAMAWARAASIPTLYVAGNHEFFGSDLSSTYARLRELARGTAVEVLERSEWRHMGVRFLGCTLWSDYRLHPSKEDRDKGIEEAAGCLHDFSRIRAAADFDDRFTPAISQLLFSQSVAWLEECFSRPFDGPTVVVTHFAPSTRSISPRFRQSRINASFVSDLEAEVLRWQPDLWLHGHTHDSFDYRIGQTRVVCNARGYARNGVNENAKFDPRLVLEIG